MVTILLRLTNNPADGFLTLELRYPFQALAHSKYLPAVVIPKSSSAAVCELDRAILNIEFSGFGVEDNVLALEILFENYRGIDIQFFGS